VNPIEYFLEQVERQPEASALITPQGRRVSYRSLARRSAARARAMRAIGIGRGDVVLIARGVSPALYETLLAVFRLGAVAMFPEPAAGLAGARAATAAARPQAIAADLLTRCVRLLVPEFRRLRAVPNLLRAFDDDAGNRQPAAALRGTSPVDEGPLESLPGDSPALITFTSGSTGAPKGIVRSADFLMLQHRLLEHIRCTTPDDVDLISLPVFILSNLLAGATSVIPVGRLTRPARLDGAALRRQIIDHGVNRIVAPPVVCERLFADVAAPLPDLTAVFTGGGPVFPNLMRVIRAAAPNARLHAVYGSTEAEPIAHVTDEQIADTDLEAMSAGGGLLAGHPIPEVELEVVDDELWVAGPHVNRGYLDPADDRTTKVLRNGRLWHRTGDAVRIDDDGRLWLLGRRSAAAGGVFPFAVEAAALGWPGVRQAALLVEDDGRMHLAVAGTAMDLDDLARRAHGIDRRITLVRLASVPMDQRHGSKVDYTRLRRMLRRR
jgi:acyl-CoA synthetase (AMP-forming)/AMP-acid ligase II